MSESTATWLYDVASDKAWANRKTAALLALGPQISTEGIAGREFFETAGAIDPHVAARLERSVRYGLSFETMFTVRSPDGLDVLVRGRADPVNNSSLYLGTLAEVGDVHWSEKKPSGLDACADCVMKALEGAAASGNAVLQQILRMALLEIGQMEAKQHPFAYRGGTV